MTSCLLLYNDCSVFDRVSLSRQVVCYCTMTAVCLIESLCHDKLSVTVQSVSVSL